MTRAHAAAAKDDPYAALRDALHDQVRNRPNYQATIDFHAQLEEMFKDTPHTVMNIPAWHWDDNLSTHVILTPDLLPSGRPVYVAITRNAHHQDLVMMADSCAYGPENPPEPAQDVDYDISHRGTVTVRTIVNDPQQVPDAVQRLAKAAIAAASIP